MPSTVPVNCCHFIFIFCNNVNNLIHITDHQPLLSYSNSFCMYRSAGPIDLRPSLTRSQHIVVQCSLVCRCRLFEDSGTSSAPGLRIKALFRSCGMNFSHWSHFTGFQQHTCRWCQGWWWGGGEVVAIEGSGEWVKVCHGYRSHWRTCQSEVEGSGTELIALLKQNETKCWLQSGYFLVLRW